LEEDLGEDFGGAFALEVFGAFFFLAVDVDFFLTAVGVFFVGAADFCCGAPDASTPQRRRPEVISQVRLRTLSGYRGKVPETNKVL